MKKLTDKELSRLYQKAPSLESPENLDSRILQRARQQVSEKRASYKPRWLPAFATACIVGIAVVVVIPEFTATKKVSEVSNIAQTERFQAQDDAQDAAMPAAQLSDLEVSESRQANVEDLSQLSEQPSEGVVSATGLSASPPSPTASIRSETQSKEEVSAAQAPTQDFQSESLVRAKKKAVIVEERLLEAESAIELDTLALGSVASLSQSQIDQKMEQIINLIKDKEYEQAQIELDRLILDCPDCGLPASIDQIDL